MTLFDNSCEGQSGEGEGRQKEWRDVQLVNQVEI